MIFTILLSASFDTPHNTLISLDDGGAGTDIVTTTIQSIADQVNSKSAFFLVRLVRLAGLNGLDLYTYFDF